MSAKGILIVCAQALLFQFALSQCTGRVNLGAGPATNGLSTPITTGLGASVYSPAIGLGYNGVGYGNAIGNGLACGAGFGYGAGLGNGAGLGYSSGVGIEVIPTSGGALPVTSFSPIAPTSLSIVSENVFDGTVFVTGELPFLSAVGLDGVVSSGGAGGVNYSCGNGVTAVESIAPSAAAYGSGAIGYGAGAYGPGLAGIAPLSIASAGCSGAYAPAAGIAAPVGGCGCRGYQDGIYY